MQKNKRQARLKTARPSDAASHERNTHFVNLEWAKALQERNTERRETNRLVKGNASQAGGGGAYIAHREVRWVMM